MFNIHPGTTSGLCEPEVSMRGISAGINRALAETRGVCVVLENVAGQARALSLCVRHLPVICSARLLCPAAWHAGLLGAGDVGHGHRAAYCGPEALFEF